MVLALGGLGVLLLACSGTSWALRRRSRASRCAVCRRHHRWQGALVASVVVLELMGIGMYVYQDRVAADPPDCGVEWFLGGVMPELTQVEEPGPAWGATRDLVTAPTTGLAHAYASARGMDFCTVGRMTVAFPSSKTRSAGTTVGDIFLTRVEPGLSGSSAESLGKHESRHVDQWTVATILAGPLALPVLYTLDETFFPGARNHFERGAGLTSGGYEQPDGFGPDPQWGAVAVLLALVLLIGRYRLRSLLFRLLPGNLPTLGGAPERCRLHARGRRG